MTPLIFNTLLYLLIGTIVGFFIELSIRMNRDSISGGGRIALIALWPIMLVFYIYHVVRGLIR